MRAALLWLGCCLGIMALAWCWLANSSESGSELALEHDRVPANQGRMRALLSEVDDGRAHTRTAVECTPLAEALDVVPQAAPHLLDCLRLEDPAAIQDCLAGSIDALDLEPARLGRLLCGPASTETARRLVVEHALLFWPAGRLLDNAAATLAACGDRSIHGSLLAQLATLAVREPDSRLALLEDLDEQHLFGASSSRLSIDLAAELARRDLDPGLRTLLESGARGQFGGQQLDRALQRAAALQESTKAKLEFLQGVAASAQLPRDYQSFEIGDSIAMLLLQPGMLDGAQRKECWRLLQDTLSHDLLGGGCALQILRRGSRDSPPNGVRSLEWELLWDSAQARIDAARTPAW